MSAFESIRAACAESPPRVAVVLGSGLAGAAADFVEAVGVDYAGVPGLASPTVSGHRGRLALGDWHGVRTLVCAGRVHFYEGHDAARVTRLVELAAELGVGKVILTNAAGGIHPDLEPGDLMAIRAHLTLLGPRDWADATPVAGPYTPELVKVSQSLGLATGVYAALTGPTYETHAEIRMLRTLGCDAVGMSTAREASAAHARGLRVAAVSCVTNSAAGLVPGKLTHSEVEATARRAVGRLAAVLGTLVQSSAGG